MKKYDIVELTYPTGNIYLIKITKITDTDRKGPSFYGKILGHKIKNYDASYLTSTPESDGTYHFTSYKEIRYLTKDEAFIWCI